jgi:hypothetical protein
MKLRPEHGLIGALLLISGFPRHATAHGNLDATAQRVLAFYYAWYATPEHSGRWQHWEQVDAERQRIGSSTHFPLGGVYDSADPALVERHFTQMAEAGIDGVILSWWGPGTRDGDHALALILDTAARHRLTVTIYLETAPGRDPVASATDALTHVLTKHGAHPAWLKVQDRPVVFMYIRAMEEVGPIERWDQVRRGVEREIGVAPFLIGDGVILEAGRVLDGLHRYNPVDLLAGLPLESLARRALARDRLDVMTARQAGKLACVTVIPGYDDTKIRRPGLSCERHDGQTYDASWIAAIQSQPDWILLTSWNEWHEGSEIEPSVEHGKKALEQTKHYSRLFHAGKRVEFPEAIAGPAPEGAKSFTLGIPGAVGIWGSPAGGIALDLLEQCVPIRLIPQDALCAGRITPGEVPVLIYVGGERVTLDCESFLALERALIEYGRSGGTLIWASPEPWPFHRNLQAAEGEPPSVRLGLELLGGYERPPEPGLRIRYLGSLEAMGEPAFPQVGDSRWRPVLPPRSPHRDFEPLAEVRTQTGRVLGTAAARWSRLSDAPGRPRVYYFAAPLWNSKERTSLLRAMLELAVTGSQDLKPGP